MKRHALLALSFSSTLFAFPYDEGQADLSDGLTLDGIETRTNGTVETYNIPISNWPPSIQLAARGGDGGRAKARSALGEDKDPRGGGGALKSGTFNIHPTDEGALRPGGEIRIIVGSRGESQTKDDLAAGGGGGATGYLYRAPVDGAEWELLVIAGGGGGANASTVTSRTFANPGKDANTTTEGDDAGSASPGGTDGEAGDSWADRAGGGAGWESGAGGTQGGDRWNVHSGAGGAPHDQGAHGGFGIAGGGASYRKYNLTTHLAGGGGGGGYSGGGAGDEEYNNTSKEGGGGGSYVDSRKTSGISLVRTSEDLNGFAEVSFSFTDITRSLDGPTIILS